MVQVIIVVVITIIYIWTAVSGIEKGIALLGDINLYLTGAILILSFLVGPMLLTMNTFTEGIGTYIQNFFIDSLHLNLLGGNEWINGWTVFYWAWWIAWAPFVGSFIARISKGRTFKEFILGVTVAPAITSLIWFAIFGSMEINVASEMPIEEAKVMASTPKTTLFTVFNHYPLAAVLSIVAVCLLIPSSSPLQTPLPSF